MAIKNKRSIGANNRSKCVYKVLHLLSGEYMYVASDLIGVMSKHKKYTYSDLQSLCYGMLPIMEREAIHIELSIGGVMGYFLTRRLAVAFVKLSFFSCTTSPNFYSARYIREFEFIKATREEIDNNTIIKLTDLVEIESVANRVHKEYLNNIYKNERIEG